MKTGMLHYKAYVAGWLDSSIDDFLERFPGTSRSAAFALITCLDSNLNPGSLLENSSELKAALIGVKPLGTGLLVPSKLLQDSSIRNLLFFGFDEIWFFPSNQIDPKPEQAWIVGPDRIDQTKLDKLGRWMTDNSCSLALGDGDGLNIIVKAHGLVKYLIAHTMCQPEPTGEMNELVKEDTEEKTRDGQGVSVLSGRPAGP